MSAVGHGVAFALGFFLDLLLGDPHWLPHPVRGIGWLIARLERALRRRFPQTPGGELAAGVWLAVLVCACSALLPLAVLALAWRVHPWLGTALEAVMTYQLLAVKSLRVESMQVYRRLKEGDLPGARRAVSMIVGRDTENLTGEQVAKAAVETVAENASDGVAAPMLFLALGGPVFGFFYKAVNTMDSMVGYRNEQYLYFGRAAAKLDDALNFIPSRVCAGVMILAAAFLGMDARGAAQIFRRDRKNHSSPNSAQTESVCAGALGVQLAGDAYYFGKLVKKKTIGDPKRRVFPEDIPKANRLMTVTACILFLLGLYLRFLPAFFGW